MKNSNRRTSVWFEIMLVLLACVAGSIDVMSYYRLGNVFTANMTGNTVLLGLSIGQGNVASSLHRLAALAGFFLGALIGAYIVENTKKGWSAYITVGISIETTIIFILVNIWFFEAKVISDFALYVSIILAGLAMGIQSATIRHLNIPGIITTFLTGTITSIGMNMVKGIKSGFKKKVKKANPAVPSPKTLEQRIELQAIVFIAYAGTAVFTGWMEFRWPRFLPVLPLILVISVLLIVIKQPGHPHLQSDNADEE
ncbi:MAG: YoaK family protein [Ginsengibacter sp.]